MPKKRKQQWSFDTSRYISLPVALVMAATVVLVGLFLVAQYSTFAGEYLMTKTAKPDPILKCAEDVKKCTDKESKDYDTCTKKVNADLATCLKKIDPKKPKTTRDKEQAACEIKAGEEADLCITNACEAGKGVPRCETMEACVNKVHKK